MRFSHIVLAVLLMAIWGFQFTTVHIALDAIPPFTLCCLRFFFTSIPLVFFLKRPAIPWKLIILYGLLTFAAQYIFFFWGMRLGMPAGMASLVYQVQVIVNIGLAYFFFNERINGSQFFGIVIAFLGLAVIAWHVGIGEKTIPVSGFFLTLAAASVWALGNMASKKAGQVNVLSLVVWGNLIAFFPLILMAWFIEGPTQMIQAWQHSSSVTLLCLIYIVAISTLVAFSIWSFLLKMYPVKTVVPFLLLVPVFGMLSALLVLGEPLPLWKIGAAALIIGGLCINFFSAYVMRAWRRVFL